MKNTTKPAISVLMTSYNEELYIKDALNSILAQTFTDFEIIIIDDGSQDLTCDIVAEIAKADDRIVFYKNELNIGIFPSLNKGLELARGRYIVKMDSDDWSYPDRIEKQFAFMEAHPDVVISGGSMEVCDSELNVLNKRAYNLTDEAVRMKLFRYSPFCHPTTIYRRDAALKAKGYNEALLAAGDYDFYFRIGVYGKFANLSDVLLKYRSNPGSISHTKSKIQEKNTFKIRYDAVREYNYKIGFFDIFYNVAQYIGMIILPQKVKYWIFNLFR